MSLWPYVRPGSEGRDRLVRRYQDALDPGRLAAGIEAGGADADVVPATIRTRAVALKKDRFIIAVEGRTRSGDPIALVAKGYADDRAAAVHANHVLLWEHGLGDLAGPVRTSRPVGLAPSLGLALSEWLPGRHPTAPEPAAAARAGEAAAALHACPAALTPILGMPAFLDNVDRHVRLLEARHPEVGAAGAVAARRLRDLVPGVADAGRAPVNGDLSLGSFLIDGPTTYLIDWDISCRFDLAWDVGHYLTQLRRFGLEAGGDTDRSRGAFLDAYERAAGAACGPGWDRRVALFEAAACLHKAYAVVRIGRDGCLDVASSLIAASSSVLARVGGGRRGRTARVE